MESVDWVSEKEKGTEKYYIWSIDSRILHVIIRRRGREAKQTISDAYKAIMKAMSLSQSRSAWAVSIGRTRYKMVW